MSYDNLPAVEIHWNALSTVFGRLLFGVILCVSNLQSVKFKIKSYYTT